MKKHTFYKARRILASALRQMSTRDTEAFRVLAEAYVRLLTEWERQLDPAEVMMPMELLWPKLEQEQKVCALCPDSKRVVELFWMDGVKVRHVVCSEHAVLLETERKKGHA